MNTVVTSREDILQHSRQLIQRQGWGAVSIRTVAQACGVSVGSISNYFGSKAELVGAVVESVWQEIFRLPPKLTLVLPLMVVMEAGVAPGLMPSQKGFTQK